MSQQRNDYHSIQGGTVLAGVVLNTDGGPVIIGDSSHSRDDQCLRDLGRNTDPRDDKARIESSKDDLLRDSWAWILNDEDFLSWRDCDETQLLWIKGDPGKGKTMMMIALVDELSSWLQDSPGSGILSYFFCQSTDARLNNAVSILRGLIYIMAHQERSLIGHVRKKYDNRGIQLFEDPNALYALWGILKDMLGDSKLPRVHLLVDALDECDSGLRQLLDLITGKDCKSTSKVKWLVASRNQPEIEQRLRPDTLRLRTDLELNSIHISRAVNAFIDSKVQHLTKHKGYDTTLQQEVESVLREKAGETFLWVALVCKELQEEVWLGETQAVLKELPPGLPPLYERMLKQIQSKKEQVAHLCTQILRSVTVTYRPLHLQELITVAHLPEQQCKDIRSMTDLVKLCGSFLTIRDGIIYFVHQSVKDYFNIGQGSRIFPSGIYEEHFEIMRRSLQVMSTDLREDICDLRKPGVLASAVGDKVRNSPLVRIEYACCYWVNHLDDYLVSPNSIQRYESSLCDNGRVHIFLPEHLLCWLKAMSLMRIHVFLQKHLLHWLEAMSLLKIMSKAGQTVRILQSIVKPSNVELFALVDDATKFILKYGALIEATPLQVYSSALIFSPRTSRVRKQFWGLVPHWIKTPPGVPESWGASLQTLEGHSGWVTAVAFSPDGKLVASASGDETTLEGHSDLVTAVAFSPDGKLVASASNDETVRLWDSATGASLQTLEGHSDSVTAVAFLADGKLVASASGDETTLEGHSGWVTAVAFSPDGKLVATVRLWDSATGAPLKTLEGHSGLGWSASASRDKTVRLWDSATGTSLADARGATRTLEGHLSSVKAVAFSPDGKLLVASASGDETVRLWDSATGAPLQTLEGHSGWVMAVAFSPDGKLVASASDDETVRLWDSATGVSLQTLEVEAVISMLSFSKEGSYLETDRGLISIQAFYYGGFQLQPPCDIFVRDRWIVRDMENLLFLPPDYRPICSTI
ncbi:WD40 repeat-like protein [Cenococcum geophilum 1.58]|uniref:WD40 repeat-like protein n=1 Tax=Cenococcum geophilum 1.58 TaxID=794803 RepID=UPI00358FE7D5|nr:WD40 repeat-like protein [Cenococcum geophilum 1.58]